MYIHYQYKKYPLAPKLTAKSKAVALLTHPVIGIAFGMIVGMVLAVPLSESEAAVLFIAAGCMIGASLLLNKLRIRKNAEYDATYAKLLADKLLSGRTTAEKE